MNGNPLILSAAAAAGGLGAPGGAFTGTGAGGAAGAGSVGGGSAATAGGLFNFGGMAAGWKGMLTQLGNIGFKPERWRVDELGNMTKIANAKGIGGMKGGALLAAGAMLAFDGLRRGGWLGVGETTAGGAMIGAKFGGPLGAAIGAGVGFLAGVVRLFVKGATEKAHDKIKALYGVDISDKGVLQQVVDTAKSAFGGNLDLAIRSPQMRDLIQLYAMSTGQKPTGMPGAVTPVSLVESGGGLYQATQYNNGQPLAGLAGLPSLDQVGGGTHDECGRDRRHSAPDRLAGGRQRGHPEWARGDARRDHRHEGQLRPARDDGASVESWDVGKLAMQNVPSRSLHAGAF